MSSQTTITKTEFLEAFKTCNKYLKCNYIEQDQFFNNMVCLMGFAKQYMPDAMNSTLDFFDAGTFRKVIVQLLTTMGPELWRDYGGLSEQMQAEANSHFFAAGKDVMGIATGKVIGKAAGKFTKSISRPYSNTLAKVGKSNGTRMRVSANRLAGTKHVPTELNASVRFKTRHTIWGTDILDWRKISSKDVVVDFSFNPIETADNYAANALMEEAHQNVAPGGRFSFSDTVMGEKLDVVTDFLPYVGNAKAAVSAVTNLAIGYEYSKTAKRIEALENQNMEADRKFINAYLYVDIERDLNAMDKETLYKMWLFASKLYNQ